MPDKLSSLNFTFYLKSRINISYIQMSVFIRHFAYPYVLLVYIPNIPII